MFFLNISVQKNKMAPYEAINKIICLKELLLT